MSINLRGMISGLGAGLQQTGQVILQDEIAKKREARLAQYRQEETAAANAHQLSRDDASREYQTAQAESNQEFQLGRDAVAAKAAETARQHGKAHDVKMLEMKQRHDRNSQMYKINDRLELKNDAQAHDKDMLNLASKMQSSEKTGEVGKKGFTADQLQKSVNTAVDNMMGDDNEDFYTGKERNRVKAIAKRIVNEGGADNIEEAARMAYKEMNTAKAHDIFKNADISVKNARRVIRDIESLPGYEEYLTSNPQTLDSFLTSKGVTGPLLEEVMASFGYGAN